METWLSRYLMAVAGLVVALLLISAAAAHARTSTPTLQSAPWVTPVSYQCIYLARDRGREVLVNACGKCITVGLIRERHGGLAPQSRRYNVQKGSTFALPFRGPGFTRMKSKFPCAREQGAVPNLAKPETAKAPEKCISIKRASAGVVLKNSCGSCRVAGVERFDARRRSLGREYLKVRKRDVLVRQRGAAQVGLIGDVECPLPLKTN